MAVDLLCDCGENHGKDTENPKYFSCGQCGDEIDNSDRGYSEEEEDE